MKIPAGIAVKNVHRSTHVLKLRKNQHDQTQAGRVWFNHLSSKLLSIGFTPSKVDLCIFYRDPCIFFFYVDDGIFMSPKEGDVNKVITDLNETHLDIEDRGNIADYLGVNFCYKKNGKVIMTQPQLINQIIADTELKPNSHLPPTPAVSSRMLRREESEPEYQGKFHYRSVVGKLNYLEKSSRPDITFAAHSCARFCENPGATHYQAVEHIVKYLKKTREKGIIMKPDKSKSLEVYADADFSRNWYKHTAADDASTASSFIFNSFSSSETLLSNSIILSLPISISFFSLKLCFRALKLLLYYYQILKLLFEFTTI